MKHGPLMVICAIAFALAAPGQVAETVQSADLGLVPVPAQIALTGQSLPMFERVAFDIQGDDAAREAAGQLANLLEQRLGVGRVDGARGTDSAGAFTIQLTTENVPADCGAEGYELRLAPGGVVLRANTSAGFYYGGQTLCQLCTPGGKPAKTLPGVHVVDAPRYSWRGMHLDVGRHFMPVEFVKRYLDLLAMHKYNVFHWHLTEDQGWRIEIKKYHKLTEVSAWRDQDGKRYGGFYTQREIREVVRYAAERHITIVPEIEMPGHTQAVLAAYPELSCTGGPFEVANEWGIFKEVFCAGNDQTFVFLENVLAEVAELFPGKYLHIGGDECPKDRWEACPKCQARIQAEGLADEHELQSYFIKRIARVLAQHNKRLIGWDEILEGGLAPSATVMSWRGTKGGVKAATMGHDVVMCPTSHCYFDYRQSEDPDEPGPHWAPPTPLKKVYAFEPTPDELSPEQAKHVLGAQGNCWTERMPNPDRVEYMVFPRACALAEVLWSPRERRDWDGFEERLEVHLQRLAALKVNYRPLDK